MALRRFTSASPIQRHEALLKYQAVGGSHMRASSHWVKNGAAFCVVVYLAACSTVNIKHPQLMSGELTAEQKAQLATVYFIRPEVDKSKGPANNPVRVSFQAKTLLEQGEGNYTLLYIKPSKGLLKVHSKTQFTDQRLPVEVWRSREYKFIAGKTYFIHVRQIDEEFRGVFYDPTPVSLDVAKQLIVPGKGRFGNTRASGAARAAPIDGLTEVNTPPASAVKSLSPALPEEIYKQEKYLQKTR